MQREIAFSSSDVLAVTTISMTSLVFLFLFFTLFISSSLSPHTLTCGHPGSRKGIAFTHFLRGIVFSPKA